MEFNSFAAPILSGNNQKKGVLKSKIIEIKYDLKEYPLEICLFENSIILICINILDFLIIYRKYMKI